MPLLRAKQSVHRQTLGIALVAAAVCVACAALICKAMKKKLSKKLLAVIGGWWMSWLRAKR